MVINAQLFDKKISEFLSLKITKKKNEGGEKMANKNVEEKEKIHGAE